jgi:hypothetical protein
MISLEVRPPMLDIHLPHKSIRGFSEFLIHLFTITVGLLIAVQIESFVEWRHHVHLAEEARVALRTEIDSNLKELQAAQPGLKAWRETIDADFNTIQKIQNHPNDPHAQHTSLSVNYSSIGLSDTAWKTAQSTGALAYMPYEEAEQYSNIYQAQAALLGYQDKPAEDVAGILGLIARYNTHSIPSSIITKEQAGYLAESFGRMRMHLLNGDLLLRRCIENNQAFLENRKSIGSFTESLH